MKIQRWIMALVTNNYIHEPWYLLGVDVRRSTFTKDRRDNK